MKIMSFNIRFITDWDQEERAWTNRAALVAGCVKKENPDIIGFQEVTPLQYEYLSEQMKGYDSVVTFRDDSECPESSPIFYKKDYYNLLRSDAFWLSETPNVMSKDWNAGCYRICSYVLLEEKNTKKQFLVFNTHLDNASEEARIKGIRVVLDRMKQEGNLPAMLMGDFNATEDSETYQSAVASFLDVKYQTENTMTGDTYQQWGEEGASCGIDYIMISKEGFLVNSYKIIAETYNGVYASDHFPITTNLSWDIKAGED